MASKRTDPVFEEEQAHLTHIYSELKRLSHLTFERMEAHEAKSREDRKAMAEELTVNLDTFDDMLETFADFASINQIVASLNSSYEAGVERLKQMSILLERPYFAKISLKFPKTGKEKELYIGASGITNEDHEHLIIDWRSPVAEVYYNQANGLTSYIANGRKIEVDLKCRRQFDIERDKLLAYFDTTVAIQDPLLLSAISKHKSSKMRSITTSIQKEQNTVIRHSDVPALLVNGIAGSGKTSVMMQRIAYLFYQMRDELSPEQVMLITPNPVFQEYIASVLPEMGEKNPRQATWKALLSSLLPAARGVGRKDVDVERFRAIDEAVSKVRLTAGDFRNIESEGLRLITKNQLFQIYKGLERMPSLHGRITMVREKLMSKVTAKIAKMAVSDKTHFEFESLSFDEQTRLLGAPLAALSDSEFAEASKRILLERYAGAIDEIERDMWVDIDRLANRLLGNASLTSLEWLYLKIQITGMGERDVRFVMIDEVQDCTEAMLEVVSAYFGNAHFLLLGDPNQAITEKTASFDRIRDLFGTRRGPLQECALMTSYRSTPQITGMFAKLAEDKAEMNISSVQRDQTPPKIETYEDEGEHLKALLDEVEAARKRQDVTAFIVPHEYDGKRLAKQLGGNAPAVLKDTDVLPEAGPLIVHLSLAKGLEFNNVVIPDASSSVFPDDDLSRRRLYTTISRATHNLVIMSLGALTPLL